MAKDTWLRNLPTTCKTLLAQELSCQEKVNEMLAEIDAELFWLNEITDEAFCMFSVKSATLQQMPKTPSLKIRAKGQKRGRQRVIDENELINKEGSPIIPKGAPTKLTFDSPKESSNYEVEKKRQVRACRKTSKAVYNDIDVPRSTRQSRNPLAIKKSNIQGQAHISPAEDVDQSAEKLSNLDNNIEIVTNIDDSKDAAKVKTFTSIVSDNSRKQSPSVRDRTKAYESMLKQRASYSPVVTLHRLTAPGSSNKTVHITKVDSPIVDSTAMDSDNTSENKNSRQTVGSGSLKSVATESRKSVARKSDASDKFPSESDDTKQIRTRLRLKKQKQNADIVESGQPNIVKSEPNAQTDMTKCQSETNYQSVYLQTAIYTSDQSDKMNDHGGSSQQFPDNHYVLDEMHTVVAEVFEIVGQGQPAVLKEFEIVHAKTTPISEVKRRQAHGDSECDQKVSKDKYAKDNSDKCEAYNKEMKVVNNDLSTNLTKEVPIVTRTRTRGQAKTDVIEEMVNYKSGEDIAPEKCSISDTTFVKDKVFEVPDVRATRTKTRTQKEMVACEVTTEGAERSTRTRQKKQEAVSAAIISQEAKANRAVPMETQPATSESFTVTRSRLRTAKCQDKLTICGSDDEIVASSPVLQIHSLKSTKKRLAEERGLSPLPKRSCIADQSSLILYHPQKTSSPNKKKGSGVYSQENDTISSPTRSPRPYKFHSVQKKPSGFLNRTPGFGQNTSKLYSFLSSTPTCRNNSVLTTFLKKTTPTPKPNSQLLQEQKRQKLLEKEHRDTERLKRAAECRIQRLDDQKRQRAEKELKVAEAREMRFRMEQEHKNRINKKIEDKATVKEKLLEERCKEEREKQKQRLRKQMEADSRRKMEEEERLKKLLEQEEETKKHLDYMQRKKEFEEAERKRQIAEEKRKLEERLAELEQKRQEDIARLRQAEEEKEKERERYRLEKERQIANERAEKERVEREKREEKERKLQEEQEKLKAMEKERLRILQEKIQQQKREEAEQNAIKQMIKNHNGSLSKQASTLNTTNNAGNTSNSKISSYDLTPAKEKVISKNKNPENYDIDDKNSDDSTDDEDAPMKKVPEWATGTRLNAALVGQHYNPPDIEKIFRTRYIEPPNLLLVFSGKKNKRYQQRTSSAIWNSPPMPHH